ncbi:MAG: helix-hairpin-helix domain-containing protein, partial [Actinomycetia bacterium]|nr:helix-hairpin-helix domain-containing protein [Actinomycetes bacterium]
RIEIIHSLEDRQHVVLAGNLEADVIGFYREETIAGVQVLSVREGRIQLANEFVLDKGLDVGDDELIRSFLLRYYESASTIPKFVFLAKLPEDSLLIADWLSGLRSAKPGARVRLQVPRQGPKRQVVLMAEQNAHHALNRFKVRSRYDEERSNLALLQLESALVLPRPPLRIECFDISTIHGQYSVGSMVVFAGGQPEKAAYRRFRIRQTSGEANDVAMMGEVLRRRYAAERQSDARFGSRPDLIIVDGGLPQLHAAQEVLREMDCTDIPIAGLAKADEELFMDWSGSAAIRLPGGSAALYLVKQIRDEAHRFAIGYHRELRGKSMRQSLLDNIPGVGPQRQQALLKAFGSLRQLRQSSVEQISAVPGISATLAQKIWEFWQRPTIDSSRDDQPPSA